VNLWLTDIEDRLQREDKEMENYGLPKPLSSKTELEKELLRYDPQQQSELYEELCRDQPNTEEQQRLFDAIVSAVTNKSPDNRLHSLCGIAGSGKTAVAKKMAAYLRSMGHIVLICAATTLACQNYGSQGASTAHRLFKFPVIDDDDRDMEEVLQCRCV
jgi:signal recognition particle GTPase